MLEQLIADRPSNRPDLTAWYTELFKAQEEAGFSIAELAELTGISVANLYLRRRRLRAETTPGLVRVVLPSTAESTPRPGAASSNFTLELSGSRRLEISAGFNAEELRRLIATLESC